MKRRDFVKSLAAAQLVMMAAETGCGKPEGSTVPAAGGAAKPNEAAPADGTVKRLNVVVHGMFAIVIDRKREKKVYLKAPEVGGTTAHRYRAQTFTVAPHNPLNLVQGWNSDYEAMSAQTTSSVEFERGKEASLGLTLPHDKRLIVDVSQKAPGISPYWTIGLPVPDDIWSLRAMPFNYLDRRKFIDGSFNESYINNGMYAWQQLPIIYVLTYDKVPVDKKVTFISGGYTQEVPFDAGVGRLHLFAEPPLTAKYGKDGYRKHLEMALGELNKLFLPNLTLHFDPNLGEPDKPLGHDSKVLFPSVLLCEERSLDEREQYATCDEFMKSYTLESQYSKVFEYRATLEALAEPRMLEGQNSIALTRMDLKPPRNCMSVIAKQS